MKKNRWQCRRRGVGGDVGGAVGRYVGGAVGGDVGDKRPLGGVASLNVDISVVRPFCLVLSFFVVLYCELLLHHLGCFDFNVNQISSFSGLFRESFYLPIFLFCIVVHLATSWVIVVVVVNFSDLFLRWIVVVVVDIFDLFRPVFFII